MTSIDISNISYSNGKIQECQLIIDSKSFKVSYQNNEYIISQGERSNQQKNESKTVDQSKNSNQQTSSDNLTKGSLESQLKEQLKNPSNTNEGKSKLEHDLALQLK